MRGTFRTTLSKAHRVQPNNTLLMKLFKQLDIVPDKTKFKAEHFGTGEQSELFAVEQW